MTANRNISHYYLPIVALGLLLGWAHPLYSQQEDEGEGMSPLTLLSVDLIQGLVMELGEENSYAVWDFNLWIENNSPKTVSSAQIKLAGYSPDDRPLFCRIFNTHLQRSYPQTMSPRSQVTISVGRFSNVNCEAIDHEFPDISLDLVRDMLPRIMDGDIMPKVEFEVLDISYEEP